MDDKKSFNDNEKLPKKIPYLAVGIALGTAVGVALSNVGLGLFGGHFL